MTKPKLDIKELEKDYLQLNNLHKLAKKISYESYTHIKAVQRKWDKHTKYREAK